MIFPNAIGFLIISIVSLALCAIGFKKLVWFMSIGYGIATAGIGLTLLIMSLTSGNISFLYIIQCLLLLVYGVRLGGFLLIRELKNEKYKAKLNEIGANTKVPFFAAFVIWVVCAALYVCQTSPAIYRLQNGFSKTTDIAFIIGLVISLAGIIIETVADKQKSAQKEKNPNLPAMEGLFKMCRCPNYFGEILFWTGIFVSGINAVQGTQWIIAICGYVGILGVMISGAKRLETRHIKNYGTLPEYNTYANKTPILIPLLPIYHLVSEKKK